MSMILILVAVAFAIGVAVGILVASGGPAGFQPRMAERRARREIEREKRRFKLVGRIGGPVKHSWIGGYIGTSHEYAYFYENALGERKVKTTDSVMDDLPAVVYFREGRTLAEVEKLAKAA